MEKGRALDRKTRRWYKAIHGTRNSSRKPMVDPKNGQSFYKVFNDASRTPSL